MSQADDRAGRVTSDGRSLTGFSGDAGTQSFTYDGLSRLTGSTGLATSRSYQYDLDGNRTRRVEGGTTTDLAYDRADELASQDIGAGHNTFDYDRYGNLVSGWDSANAQTTYAYDEASRLTTISPPGGAATQVTFSIDALDRHATRSLGGSLSDTYAYLDATETAWQTGASGATGSLLDADGTRLAVKTGGTVSWLVFDLHGSVTGLCTGTATLTDAYRFDGFGQQIAVSGTATNPFRYRGLLNIGADAVLGALLDMGARDYSPQLGAFTQEDSAQGGAANPLTMNRFLYALANPATLVDPDGHMAAYVGGTDTWTAPKPWKGLRDGGDCNQSCVDTLNNKYGVNTYGEAGAPGGSFAPPGMEPAPQGMHWSNAGTISSQWTLQYDTCSIDDAGYYQGECINEVQMQAIEDFAGGVIEGSVQAAAIGFFCGVTAGGCALLTGYFVVNTAQTVNEGGLEALVPQDAKGWGQLIGLFGFGGFAGGRTAQTGSSVRGAVTSAYGRLENYYSWANVRGRLGPARSQTNPIFWNGVEYLERTHTFLPRRSSVPNFIKNRNWNIREQWGTTHALNDPFRFKFMPQWWRIANEKKQKSGLQALWSRIFDT